MNHQQCIKAANKIRELFLDDHEPLQSAEGNNPNHLAWMIEQIPHLSENKAMRWLGYIQGALVMAGFATLQEMKHVSSWSVYEEEPKPNG